jgi:hypothetical protein
MFHNSCSSGDQTVLRAGWNAARSKHPPVHALPYHLKAVPVTTKANVGVHADITELDIAIVAIHAPIVTLMAARRCVRRKVNSTVTARGARATSRPMVIV